MRVDCGSGFWGLIVVQVYAGWLWFRFRNIKPIKENVWGVKVRWPTNTIAIFLGLNEEEYQSIQTQQVKNKKLKQIKSKRCLTSKKEN